MRLSKELNSVTPFSKLIALILFFLLPILGFYLGLRYQNPQDFPPVFQDTKPTEGYCEPGSEFCRIQNTEITPTLPWGKQCTLEAKLCPDGSSVGRTGPNCEFAPCPVGQ